MTENQEELMAEKAKELLGVIRESLDNAQNEHELRQPIDTFISEFTKAFSLKPKVGMERTLLEGDRADTVFNRLVIEYEAPCSLYPDNERRTNRHAIGQVKGYMSGLSARERQNIESLAGVVLDGVYFIFIRYRDGSWKVDEPVPVDLHSCELFLKTVLSVAEKSLTEANLVKSFGEGEPFTKACIPVLYKALVSNLTAEGQKYHYRTKALYEQWVTMFQEVCNYQEGARELAAYIQNMGFGARDKVEPGLFFFTVHTYYAVIIKLLAVQIVHHYLTRLGTSLEVLLHSSPDELRDHMVDLEDGELFRKLGIGNFLEGDFFGWYLSAWNDEVYKQIKEMIRILADYDLGSFDVDPEMTRDLLKHLYQNLMPKALRHDLGEYYTPDWIAERLLNQLTLPKNINDPTIDSKIRLLDPACGSGTFLVLAIKRMKRWAALNSIHAGELLEKVLSNVVGFDLNPLAVITARTNYLLALGELLKARKTEINIPVYLCDSILTPSQAEDIYESEAYRFNTSVGEFSVPTLIVRKRKIGELADFLEESVKNGLATEAFVKRAMSRFGIEDKPGEGAQAMRVLRELYEKLLDLEKKGVNGIWARIIKNAFAPLFIGQFDYVMGNPPWVNWESLPDGYRNDLIGLYQHTYDLFLVKGLKARHGSAKVDISALMTYVSADKYLKDGGKLGFVITQSLLKTGASAGFRKFAITKSATAGQKPQKVIPLRVMVADDMVALNPFEGASNRTAIIVLKKGEKNRYPVPYTLWKKMPRVSLPTDMTISEAQERTTRSNLVAEPVDENDPTSPWLTWRPKAIKAAKKVLGSSHYVAHEGVNTGGANAVYWVNIIQERPDGLVIVSNITEGAKRKVKNVQAVLEPDLLYPLLRGRDVQKWSAKPSIYLITPQDPERPNKGYPEESLKEDYPKIYAYLKAFEAELRARSGYKKYLEPFGAPFYALYGIKAYTFAPWKVVWKYISSHFTSAVIGSQDDEFLGERVILPNEKLMLVGLESKEEAFYLCAVLNSSPARYAVESFMVSTQIATHVIANLAIPRFNPNNNTHEKLSELSVAAHDAAGAGDEDRIRELEEEIDRLVTGLWGLAEEEIKEIKKSLEEM